jgi:hypothetical protein
MAQSSHLLEFSAYLVQPIGMFLPLLRGLGQLPDFLLQRPQTCTG